MPNIFKGDFYRLWKSKLLYAAMLFTAFIAFALVMLMRRDIRIGISVVGNLTAFRQMDDVIRIGLAYYKGLGIFIAILISVFIGQEYQWKTWQHKWNISKSRVRIYLSKAILSSVTAATIFLIFEMVILFNSKQIQELLANGYGLTIICGISIYAALGAIICMLSMLIKNITVSTVVCLCYVVFSETMVSLVRNISSFSDAVSRFAELGIRHSLFGISVLATTMPVTANLTISIALNSVAIILLSGTIGLIVFRKYEL